MPILGNLFEIYYKIHFINFYIILFKRISSLFAESEEEYLNFRLNESGVLDMLQTNYSVSLTDMMQKHLVARNSLPAFLSTLTLELFNKTTNVVNATRI